MSMITALVFSLWSISGLLVLFLGMFGLYGVLVLCIVLAMGRGPETPTRAAMPGPRPKARKGVRPLAAGCYPAPKTIKLSPY